MTEPLPRYRHIAIEHVDGDFLVHTRQAASRAWDTEGPMSFAMAARAITETRGNFDFTFRAVPVETDPEFDPDGSMVPDRLLYVLRASDGIWRFISLDATRGPVLAGSDTAVADVRGWLEAWAKSEIQKERTERGWRHRLQEIHLRYEFPAEELLGASERAPLAPGL